MWRDAALLRRLEDLATASRGHPFLERPDAELRVDRDGAWARVNGCWFAVSQESWALLSRPFEEAEHTEMSRHIGTAARVFDVGANFGLHSVALAQRFPDARIDAFEPAPRALALLRANVAKNAATGVVIHPVAVSSASGDATITTEFSTGNRLLIASDRIPPRCERVRAVRLDDFWAAEGRPAVHLVKIDVEGAEWHVLRGAEQLLRTRPVLMIEIVAEWSARLGRSPEDCRALLLAADYRIVRAREDAFSRKYDAATFPLDAGGNYLFSAS